MTENTTDPMAAVRQTLAEMRAVVDGATEGEWITWHGHTAVGVDTPARNIARTGCWDDQRAFADAAHIATFDPPTVRRLLDVLDGVVGLATLAEQADHETDRTVPAADLRAMLAGIGGAR